MKALPGWHFAPVNGTLCLWMGMESQGVLVLASSRQLEGKFPLQISGWKGGVRTWTPPAVPVSPKSLPVSPKWRQLFTALPKASHLNMEVSSYVSLNALNFLCNFKNVHSFQVTMRSFFLWPCIAACRILVPWPGIEPMPPPALPCPAPPCPVEAQSPNYWTTGEFPFRTV